MVERFDCASVHHHWVGLEQLHSLLDHAQDPVKAPRLADSCSKHLKKLCTCRMCLHQNPERRQHNHLPTRQSTHLLKVTSLVPCRGAGRQEPMKTHRGAQWLCPGPRAARWSFAGAEPLQWLCPAKHQWAAPGPRRCIWKNSMHLLHLDPCARSVGQGISDAAGRWLSCCHMTPRTDPIRAKSALFEAVGPCVSVSETWAASPGFTAAQQPATEAGGFSLAVHKSKEPTPKQQK